jgi:hypothetical protein
MAVFHPNWGGYDLVLRNCGHVPDVEFLALDGLVLSTARPTGLTRCWQEGSDELTSIMIANGTHIATAQQIPTRLMNIVAYSPNSIRTCTFGVLSDKRAWNTVDMKNVESINKLKKTSAPVQIFLRRNGITGRWRALPLRAASILH